MNKLSYRQIHLDFHTPNLPYPLGKNFDKETFQKRLKQGHVTSITLTARCHHGHIYYDSKFSAKHPQMENDFLMGLVDACHEIGVKCPLYLTAGWDAYMADRHPEWLERNPDGTMFGFENFGQLEPGWKTLCFNTEYSDYLFQQTKETMQHFEGKLDGLFFDIVRQDPCCCNSCMKKMTEAGFDPTNFDDRKAFGLQTKIQFKKKMSSFIHDIDPSCSVFYNEGNITPDIRTNLDDYSHFEIESLASGDWGYQHFPVAVRYAKNLGKEYMGMTGKFQRNWADFGSYKNQAALEYECFLAIAHGAKCSIGDQMYGDGTLQEATYNLIGNVYQKVEEYQPWVENTLPVTEIAILHTDLYQKSKEKVNISLAGAVNMLNEAHLQFDIVDGEMDFLGYRLLILPDQVEVSVELSKKIDDYVKKGGKLLTTYKAGRVLNTDKSIPSMGVTYLSEADFEPMYAVFPPEYNLFLSKGEQVLHGKGMYLDYVEPAVEVGQLWEPMYNRTYQHYYSHYQAPINCKSSYPLAIKNEGGIYFSHELFAMYKSLGVKEYKLMILTAIRELIGDSFVSTDAPSTADIILNYQPDQQRLILNYLNYVPERRSIRVETIEERTPVCNTHFELDIQAIATKIGRSMDVRGIMAVSSGEKVSFEVEGDKLVFELPYLDGYELIEIELETEKVL